MYKKLKTMRLSKKYTTQDMGSKLGISKAFYCQIERGNRRLTYEMAVKIASIFKVKPDTIFYADQVEKLSN